MKRLIPFFLLFPAVLLGQVSSGLSSPNSIVIVTNAGSTGTTLNTLTKLTGAPSTAVIAATSDTAGVVGVTIAGAGTSGIASIQVNGIVSLVFDGATTAGHYVQISAITAGNGHDTGSTSCPSSGQVVGRVLSTNGGGGTYQVNLGSNGCGSGGGSVSPSAAFNIATGAAATPAAPYLIAPSTGTVSNCYFITTTSDGVTNLVFNVKFNGTNIISGTNATVTAGTSAGTISTFSLTSGTIAITQGQKWELDITTGTSSWTGVVQCY